MSAKIEMLLLPVRSGLALRFDPGRPKHLSWSRPGKLFSFIVIISLALAFWLYSPLFTTVKSKSAVFKTASNGAKEQSLTATSPALDSSTAPNSIGLLQSTTCDTYYLHKQTKSVGNHGSQRIADVTAPTAATPSVIQATLPLLSANNVEIARFYSDPVTPLTYPLIGDIVGSIWLQSTDFENIENITFTVNMFDYNPANGNVVALGSLEFIIITDGQNEAELVITPPGGASLAANHRLLLILYARKPVLISPTVSLFYDSAERASQFTFCHPAPPKLTISKNGPPAAIAGQPITYTLTIANSGGLAATNLVISDTIPAGATYISGGTLNGNRVTWSAGSLNPNSSIQRSFIVTASQTITNHDYQVKADSNFSANGQKAVVTVVSPPGQPNLVISKSGPGQVTIGELITYTLAVTNSGDVAASGMKITDTLPAGATYVSGGMLNGNAVTWLIDTPLDPRASLQRSFAVTATQTITNKDYEVTALPNISTVGQNAVTTQVVPRKVYLPLTLKTEPDEPKTTLLIQSVNTNGISVVQILQASNNQELLRCTNIGNNVTASCGSFKAVGSYKIIANTNKCGVLQGTFNDAAPGATVTRRIFCN